MKYFNEPKNLDDLTSQYSRLAAKYHPDANPGREDEANEIMQGIIAEHDTLFEPLFLAWLDGSTPT